MLYELVQDLARGLEADSYFASVVVTRNEFKFNDRPKGPVLINAPR